MGWPVILASCLRPMLSSEPELLVMRFQTVLSSEPSMTPHRISLVVGTSTLRRSSTTVVVLVVPPVEPEPEELPPVEPLPEPEELPPEEPLPEELSPLPPEPPVKPPRMEPALMARFFTSSSTPYFHRSPVTSFRIRRSICPCSFSV